MNWKWEAKKGRGNRKNVEWKKATKSECQRREKAEKEESVWLHVPSIPQALVYLEGARNRNSDCSAEPVTDRSLPHFSSVHYHEHYQLENSRECNSIPIRNTATNLPKKYEQLRATTKTTSIYSCTPLVCNIILLTKGSQTSTILLQKAQLFLCIIIKNLTKFYTTYNPC